MTPHAVAACTGALAGLLVALNAVVLAVALHRMDDAKARRARIWDRREWPALMRRCQRVRDAVALDPREIRAATARISKAYDEFLRLHEQFQRALAREKYQGRGW